MTRKTKWRMAIYGSAALALGWLLSVMFWMPGPKTPQEREPLPLADMDALAEELRRDVVGLGGERNMDKPEAYEAALRYIESELKKAGYQPKRQTYEVGGEPCHNLEVERPGNQEIVVVGAHYDTVWGSPGANDNGSGTAATLALARRFANRDTTRTLRFVWFANEEPPYFQGDDMGSVVYAKRCKARQENVVAMASIETIGYYDQNPDSQQYPHELMRSIYGDRGNFLAFVSNISSAGLLKECLGEFRKHSTVKTQGAPMIEALPGVGWSDHWSFWQQGYRAFMITDTAPYRYPHYHQETDTPDKLDYRVMADIVASFGHVVDRLARPESGQ